MKTPVYLDYAATTPCDPLVAEVIMKCLTLDGNFANPASRSHFYGWQAEAAVEKARKQVAKLLGSDTREIVWTSGATEANNLAIKGAVAARSSKGNHIVTSLAEHKAVIDSVSFLEQEGFEVSWVKPEKTGQVSLAEIKKVTRPDTVLISVMHVNNETGAITDIDSIAQYAQSKNILFHVDAAQSAGKLHIDTAKIPVDMISVCAHKIYGPKGVGALFVRKRAGLILPAQIHGGGHEQGMRSGTLPTHQIVAMGAAFELASALIDQEHDRLSEFKSLFLEKLMLHKNVLLNGSIECSVPGIVNLTFKGVDGQVLLSALPMLAISSGSACNSATVSPSHVLRSMGVTEQEALSALRFSFGRFTTKEEVIFAADSLLNVLDKLSP
ncbi:MAG: cysteine desulfurase [Oleiphilaceae bacterium]|jgi:cysteine desulfurase